MKRFSRIFVIGLMFLILPILFACNNNDKTKNNDNKNSYTISFDICFLDGSKLDAPIKSNDNYLVKYSDSTLLNIDSHGIDILKAIEENTEVTLTIYYSIFSQIQELKINNNDISFVENEVEDRKSVEFSFSLKSNTTISIKGDFYE